jgi:8-amino-7-oxononanoate synthase
MREEFKPHKLTQKAQMLKDMNLYPFFSRIEDSEARRVIVSGKEQIMIGSNNYLGLTHHPYVIEKTKQAIDRFGTGCTGSRFLNGNLVIHEELEEKLAKYLGHEKALVFSTGMQTNLGTISAICGPKDCMLFDAENHASILDASRLSFGATFKYKHNDMDSLEESLVSNVNRFQKVFIVTDGVFSMTGDVAKLPEIVALAKKYGAYIYVDDAHGIGVMGPKGKGTMHHFGVTESIDFNMGTFSKSFASIGGVISGTAELMDHVKHLARSFMFSAAMPPSAVATVSACLDVIEKEPEIFDRLWANVKFMREGFKEIGFYTYNSQTPIIPIFIGDDIKAMQVTAYLREKGIFCTPVISPAVPKGEALIRTSYMATHNKEDLSLALEAFKEAKRDLQIPSQRH